MQQVFFQETEYLNSVIDYNHKVETENFYLVAEFRLLQY